MLAKKARDVLEVLQRHGVLEHLVLIGSWCCHFYISYFDKGRYIPTIQTLDIDLLIPSPRTLPSSLPSITTLLDPLEFISDHSMSGWLRFIHPELRVEFLIPRLGPQSDDPRKVPQLKVNAMPLRHTAMLTEHLIDVKEGGLRIRLPHPAAFAFHKIFVSGRRQDKGKKSRDMEMSLRLFDAFQARGDREEVKRIWKTFTKKEKNEIRDVLEREERQDLITNYCS